MIPSKGRAKIILPRTIYEKDKLVWEKSKYISLKFWCQGRCKITMGLTSRVAIMTDKQ